jgi:hypothetical protein
MSKALGAPKSGGRKKGTPNNRTIALRQQHEQALAHARAGEHRLALPVLADGLRRCVEMVERHEPKPEGTKAAAFDAAEYKDWLRMMFMFASGLAPYQAAKHVASKHDVGDALPRRHEHEGAAQALIKLVDAYALAAEQNRKAIETQAIESKTEPEQNPAADYVPKLVVIGK